jgi:hypothetical protein
LLKTLKYMKAHIATFLAMAAGVRLAMATDTFPAITTMDGKTYDHITAQRADPDGLYIEYAPGGKGMGSAKLKFNRLSADLQKQYGYDADAARKYEDETYKATLTFQTWADQQEAAHQKALADAAARELQEETILAQRMPVPTAPTPVDPGTYGGGSSYYDGGWSYGSVGSFNRPNHFTGSTFRGNVPFDQLYTPLGFSPTKTQVLPATPRNGQNAGRPSGRQH